MTTHRSHISESSGPGFACLTGEDRTIRLQDIPLLTYLYFRPEIIARLAGGERVAAFFYHSAEGYPLLYIIFTNDGNGSFSLGKCRVEGNRFPSLINICPAVHLFEREIQEQWGIEFFQFAIERFAVQTQGF